MHLENITYIPVISNVGLKLKKKKSIKAGIQKNEHFILMSFETLPTYFFLYFFIRSNMPISLAKSKNEAKIFILIKTKMTDY